MLCISLAIISRLSRFLSPAVGTNWPFRVDTSERPTNLHVKYKYRYELIDHTAQVYENVLHNWISLTSRRRRVRAIMYDATMSPINTNDTVQKSTYTGYKVRPRIIEQLTIKAARLGWNVVDLYRVSPYGVPYLKDMYSETAARFSSCKFASYVNGDIMFGEGIVETLEAVEKVSSFYAVRIRLLEIYRCYRWRENIARAYWIHNMNDGSWSMHVGRVANAH